MKKIAIVFVTVLLTISANAECKPKWCSGKQLSNYTEVTICEHPILWATDATLSSIYKELIGYKGQKGHQENWYRVDNVICISFVYFNNLYLLNKIIL